MKTVRFKNGELQVKQNKKWKSGVDYLKEIADSITVNQRLNTLECKIQGKHNPIIYVKHETTSYGFYKSEMFWFKCNSCRQTTVYMEEQLNQVQRKILELQGIIKKKISKKGR